MIIFALLPGLLLMTSSDTAYDSLDSDLGWYVLNDNVMGGRSEGGFEQQAGEVVFTGRTNTNGGGFSSIRTKPLQLDLSNSSGVRLSVKGDGRRYTWQLSSTARWRGRQISYWADFETCKGEWRTVDIPFTSFIPRFRGVELEGPTLDPRQIAGMGLMIYDKEDGPFEIRLASVGTYVAQADFSLQQYQWKNRILVLSAPGENDENFRSQLSELARAAKEFQDRDMILVTLLDDGTSIAGDTRLTAGDVSATRAALGLGGASFSVTLVGKDGSKKLSRAAPAPMTEIYALIDSMPMRRSEISARQ
jgi:hypothetical protein